MERQTAELVVDTIIYDLADRGGLKRAWAEIVNDEEDLIGEIRKKWIGIIEGEDDPGGAVDAIVLDLSGRCGLDREWDIIDKDIKEEIRKTWETIFSSGNEIAQAVRDELPAQLEEDGQLTELDPELRFTEDEVRAMAVSAILGRCRRKVLKELGEEQE